MSSHHIVREKQEPALLILDLEGFNYEHLGQLLEWSPTVLVDEPFYDMADSLGIKIDGVISKSLSSPLQHKTFIIHTEDSPLQDALKHLAGDQYHAVNIITTSFCVKDYALFADRITVVVLTPEKRIFAVKPGFSKWKVKGETIEILSETQHLKIEGLRKIKDHLYKTEKEGFFTLTFEQPFLFIAESY